MSVDRQLWLRYAFSLVLVAGATLLGALVQQIFSPANLVMIYLLAVVVAAVWAGRGPSIVVAVLGVLAFDFFFVHPRLTLTITDRQDFLTFVALFIVGLVISNLTAVARAHASAAERRAAHNAALYAFSRDLGVAAGLDEIVRAVVAHASATFDGQASVLLPEGDALRPWGDGPELVPAGEEMDAAMLVFWSGRPAARGTGRETGSRLLPLATARGVLGVLAVKSRDAADLLPDQRQLLDTFASQAALAIERAQLAEQARQAEALQAADKLQSALLNSISHDLRTPLVSIVGALSSLQDDTGELDLSVRRSLVDNALGEAERLNRLVGNLLDMTRIEAGSLKVRRELCDVQDLIGAAVERLDRRLSGRRVSINVPPDMPLVSLDFVLMEQVLVNLLENAAKYSPPCTPIDVQAYVEPMAVRIEVADRGAGIPAGDLSRVFDKFYRVQQPGGVSGTGLGLSICKGIVEAHGGSVWARNRDGGGAILAAALPLGSAGEEVL